MEWSASILIFLYLPVFFRRAAPRPLPLWYRSSAAEIMRIICAVGELRYVLLNMDTRPARSDLQSIGLSL